jgi:hypothetical protein
VSSPLGLRSLSSSVDTVLVALADQPLVNAQDIVDLLGAYRQRPAGTSLVRADVNGQPGNPVVFSIHVCKEILTSDPGFGGKQWQEAHPDQSIAGSAGIPTTAWMSIARKTSSFWLHEPGIDCTGPWTCLPRLSMLKLSRHV